jgi:hypothetical protein
MTANLTANLPACLPALIWTCSAIICHIIAKRRHIAATTPKAIAATFLGPFAIPYFLAIRQQQPRQ